MSADLYLGADTGGTGVKFVITDADGVVLHEGDLPTDPESGPATVTLLASAARDRLDGSLDRLAAVARIDRDTHHRDRDQRPHQLGVRTAPQRPAAGRGLLPAVPGRDRPAGCRDCLRTRQAGC